MNIANTMPATKFQREKPDGIIVFVLSASADAGRETATEEHQTDDRTNDQKASGTGGLILRTEHHEATL